MSIQQILKSGCACLNAGTSSFRQNGLHSLKTFFSLPLQIKQQFSRPLSEENGYRNLEFKELFIYRGGPLPEELKPILPLAQRLHQVAIAQLNLIEQQLHLQTGILANLVEKDWSENNSCNSVIRLLKYHPQTAQLPCDPHEDLGLISIVLKSTSPSLEILDNHSGNWKNVETTLSDNDVVLLAGCSLQKLTENGTTNLSRFTASTHRVVNQIQKRKMTIPLIILTISSLVIAFFTSVLTSIVLCSLVGGVIAYRAKILQQKQQNEPRYSIVYQMRIKEDALLQSHHFISDVLAQPVPFNITGKVLLAQLRNGRASVNGTY